MSENLRLTARRFGELPSVSRWRGFCKSRQMAEKSGCTMKQSRGSLEAVWVGEGNRGPTRNLLCEASVNFYGTSSTKSIQQTVRVSGCNYCKSIQKSGFFEVPVNSQFAHSGLVKRRNNILSSATLVKTGSVKV